MQASDTVGPTRLALLTAGSVKLPVVIVDPSTTVAYHVFSVESLQEACAGQLSPTPLTTALDLAQRTPLAGVEPDRATPADLGSPAVKQGTVVGVIAADVEERPEPTEQDMQREMATEDTGGGSEKKRRGWNPFARS